ncbi:hypothetical protein ACSSS7_003843 [Eimeria intestinalis]
MLHHSASAACLTSPRRGYPMASRTYSSLHIEGEPKGTRSSMRLSKGASSVSRTGMMSDEETCAASDEGLLSQAHLCRVTSSIGSRRPSAESFEDAVESFPKEAPFAPHVADACYSSFAFSFRAVEGGEGTSPRPRWREPEPALRYASSPRLARASTPPRSRRDQRSYAPASQNDAALKKSMSVEQERRTDLSLQQDDTMVAPPPSTLNTSRSTTTPRTAREATPRTPKVESSRANQAQQRRARGSRRLDAPPLERTDLPRSATRETSLAGRKKTAINRYASVPAYSVADQLRVNEFKEGLPKAMTPQEALKLQREREERRRRDEELLRGPGPFDMSSDLAQPVDWKSLLNAAGLGDVADGDIALEAEELQAKLDQYAPRTPFSWLLDASTMQRR